MIQYSLGMPLSYHRKQHNYFFRRLLFILLLPFCHRMCTLCNFKGNDIWANPMKLKYWKCLLNLNVFKVNTNYQQTEYIPNICIKCLFAKYPFFSVSKTSNIYVIGYVYFERLIIYTLYSPLYVKIQNLFAIFLVAGYYIWL